MPKMLSRALRTTIPLALVLAAAGCDQKSAPPEPRQTNATSTAAKPPAKAPAAGSVKPFAVDFALPDEKGASLRLSDYKGKVVVVDFWATWCPPCRQEIPGFVQIKKDYADRGVEIIGVAVNDDWPKIAAFSRQNGINYPVVMGDEATASAFGGFNGIPTTFVVDKEGMVRKKHVGYAPPSFFVSAIEELL